MYAAYRPAFLLVKSQLFRRLLLRYFLCRADVGTVMSIWALMALMYDEKHQDVPLIGGSWSLFYFMSAVMEEHF